MLAWYTPVSRSLVGRSICCLEEIYTGDGSLLLMQPHEMMLPFDSNAKPKPLAKFLVLYTPHSITTATWLSMYLLISPKKQAAMILTPPAAILPR
jgi:hypothetical protein